MASRHVLYSLEGLFTESGIGWGWNKGLYYKGFFNGVQKGI